VLFALAVTLILSSLLLMHKFEPSMIDILKKYDSLPIVKKVWYFFSLIMNVILTCFGPCHRVIDNKINKNKDMVKKKLFGQFANFNIGNKNSGILDIFNELSIFSNNSSPQTDFNNLDVFFKNQNKKNTDSPLRSIPDKYIIQSPNSEYKDKNTELTPNNTVNTLSDIEEPLDNILLKHSKNEQNETSEILDDKTDITNFFNKMQVIKDKVNNADIVVNSIEQDVFNRDNDSLSDNNTSNAEESDIYKMD
jgi:hypothetical protein